MVDYTSKPKEGGGVWMYAVGAILVLVLLFALFAGAGTGSSDLAPLEATPIVTE